MEKKPDMNDPKLENIVKQHVKTNSLKLNILFSQEFIENLIQNCNFNKPKDNIKHPTVFKLQQKNEDPEKRKVLEDMQLIKILIKCNECDYEYGISKNDLDKAYRKGKPFKYNQALQHKLKFKHKMMVEQTFQKYDPKIEVIKKLGFIKVKP